MENKNINMLYMGLISCILGHSLCPSSRKIYDNTFIHKGYYRLIHPSDTRGQMQQHNADKYVNYFSHPTLSVLLSEH